MKSRYGLGFVGLGLAAVYYCFDPAFYAFFPACPFRALTGYLCAGCGSQRAIHQLLHGHLTTAWQLNPLLVAAIPYLSVGFWLEYGPAWSQHEGWRRRFYGLTAIRIILGVVITFWIGRNC